MRKTAQTMFKEEAKDMAGAASADIERVRLEMPWIKTLVRSA